jgi:hypothetical protein
MERAWDDPMFEIHSLSSGDTAYASDIAGAYLAFWTLRKESNVHGTKVKIINLDSGKLVWCG